MKISDMKTSDEVHDEDLANNPEYRKEWEGMSEDPFGAKSVWQSHYDLAIETMHPISAVEAANAAALAYAKGNTYISMGGKGDAAEYRVIRSKEVGR